MSGKNEPSSGTKQDEDGTGSRRDQTAPNHADRKKGAEKPPSREEIAEGEATKGGYG